MKRIFKFLLKTILCFALLSVVWVLVYKFVQVPYTPLMAIRYFEAENSYETKHQWKSIDEISEEIQLAVICSEDQNFIYHNGFDVKAIKKAYKDNQTGRQIRGGSWIKQI